MMNKTLKGSLNNFVLGDKKILNTQELVEIIDRLKATYYIQPESNDDSVGFIICGVFKLLKNKTDESIRFFQYELTSDVVGSWVELPIKCIPASLPLFFRKGSNPTTHYLLDWRREAFKLIIVKLYEAGYRFTGFFKTTDDVVYFDDLNEGVIVGKNLFFYNEWGVFPTSDGKVEFIYDDGFYIDSENEIDSKIRIRQDMIDLVWGRKILIRSSDVMIGQKTLFQEIRKIIDKEWLSLLVRANTSSFGELTEITNKSLFHIDLMDYLEFKRVLIPSGVGNLNKFLRHCCKNKRKHVVIDGTTKQIFDLLKCQSYLSLKDLKFLRHAPAHHSAYVALLIGDKKMTDKKRSQIKNAMVILRNPIVKKYPSTVIYRVLRELKRKNSECSLKIIGRWLDYYQDLYKNIGFSKQKQRWRAEINQLEHVLHWGEEMQIQVNKNQMWPSFNRLAIAWIQEVNKCGTRNYPEKWEATLVEWNSIPEYQIEEIHHADLLYKEGDEMMHCVASYHGLCAEGKYKVFSIKYKQERATLGISIIDTSDTYEQFRIDQMRGYGNDAVNSHMVKIGKQILTLVNKSQGCEKE